MVSLAVLGLGLAVVCWPPARSAGRLRRLVGADRRARGGLRLPRPTILMVAVGAAVAGFLVGGVGGGLAAGLAGATAWRRFTARRRMRHTLAAVAGLAEALRSLVAELRAGAHPAAAAEAAAIDAEPAAAQALRSIAAAARLDGDVERALETRVRFARQVLARMAGPRASATILALLPTVGIALGEAMGARPGHILTATAGGQLLLVVGTALACAGVTWSARITNQVVLT